MKISIIIPTYNDEKFILDTFASIDKQSYQNYEVIIVNDGSTDSTEKVVKKYIKEKNNYKYIYQENQDQLRAIMNGSNYITGDLVFILHSDDMLASKDVLKCANEYFICNNVDAIIADLSLVDENGKNIGIQKTKNFNSKKNYSVLQTYLYLGRNIYCDTAFFKKDVFMSKVMNNYLMWNRPFWFDDKGNVLCVNKVDFPFISYRQSDSNYILSDLGKLNVLNGELRCINTLCNLYSIPFYCFQFNVYRVFNKLNINYSPIYKNKKVNNKFNLFNFVIRKRYNDEEIRNNIYLNSLLTFYKNNNKRSIEFNFSKVYLGCDIRSFNKKLLTNTLEKEYYDFFDEMQKGFDKIITKDANKMKNVLNFLNINAKIEVKK